MLHADEIVAVLQTGQQSVEATSVAFDGVRVILQKGLHQKDGGLGDQVAVRSMPGVNSTAAA